jgi:hypothetical protein
MSVINTLASDIIKAVIQWLKKLWFESKLKARLTMIEWDNKRDYYWELNKDFEPVYREYPPENPDSEAAKLGGAMRLTARHHESYETEEDLMEAYRQSDL